LNTDQLISILSPPISSHPTAHRLNMHAELRCRMHVEVKSQVYNKSEMQIRSMMKIERQENEREKKKLSRPAAAAKRISLRKIFAFTNNC
jgi:hypothetical protein